MENEREETVSDRVRRMKDAAVEAGLFNEWGEWWEDGVLVMLHPDAVLKPAPLASEVETEIHKGGSTVGT